MRTRLAATVAVVLTVALALVGCGGGGTSANPAIGRYEGYATIIQEESTAFDDTYAGGENYLELKSDGAAVLCLDGSSTDATYSLNGDNITVTIGDVDSGETYDSSGTVKDGVLRIDFLGSGVEFVFLMDGVAAPFELDVVGTGQSVTDDDVASDEAVDGEAEATEIDEPADLEPSESGEASDNEQS